jgi:transcriptional regulator
MYIPHPYAEHDLPTLLDFLESHPLAALVTTSETTGLVATHLPLMLDREAAPNGALVGHLARANPQYTQIAAGRTEAIVIFTGPNAYITPAWYPTKRETGRVVPTWNYVAIHAYGTVSLRDDRDFLRQHLETLTSRHEADRASSWQVSDAPEDFIANQMKAIVAFELRIERLEGKWKMSQNRSGADIEGVIRGLAASEVATDRTVAALVAERRPEGK